MRKLEQVAIHDFDKLQSAIMLGQAAIQTLQLVSSKVPLLGGFLGKGLEKANFALGMLNSATAAAEAGVYFAAGDKKDAEQLLEFGALDFLGNFVAFETSTLQSIANPLLRNTLLLTRKAGIVSEYLLSGQAAMVGMTDIQQGQKGSGIGILTATAVQLAFTARDAFHTEEPSEEEDLIGFGRANTRNSEQDLSRGAAAPQEQDNTRTSISRRSTETNETPLSRESQTLDEPFLGRSQRDEPAVEMSRPNYWELTFELVKKPVVREFAYISALGTVGGIVSELTVNPNSF